MPHATYLIIGAGMTADAATQGIRDLDRDGTIGLIGAEPVAPDDRPPLSKALWKGERQESIRRATAERGVGLYLGRTARELDPVGKRVTDDRGTRYTYDKLLLATDCSPDASRSATMRSSTTARWPTTSACAPSPRRSDASR